MDKDTIPKRKSNTEESPISEGNKEATKASIVSTRRRRLIKASAAAVPAIMTLRSGDALALTSLDCRDLTEVRYTAGLISHDPDAWVRIPGCPARRLYYIDTIYYYLGLIQGKHRYYTAADGKKVSLNKIEDESLKTALVELAGTPDPNCFFVNKAYKQTQTCFADETEGWECAFQIGSLDTATKEDVNGNPLVNHLYEWCGTEIEMQQLLAFFTWDGDEICGVTYAPMSTVTNDVAGAAPITGSCMCSVNPDYNTCMGG